MAKKTNFSVNGQDYYRVTTTIGFDSKGNRIRKTFYGESKKDAERQRDDYVKGSSSGFIDYDKLTFGEVFEQWFEEVNGQRLSASSYNRAAAIARLYVKPANFYNLPLIQINSLHLQRHVNQIELPGQANRGLLLIKTFFKYCVKQRFVIYNPTDGVIERRIEIVEKKKFLNQDDIVKIFEAFKKDDALFIYIFAMLTGLREGELSALAIKDVNLDAMTIHVTKSLGRVTVKGESKIIITRPKTDAGVRDIPILTDLIEPIKQHLRSEQEKKLKNGGGRLLPDDLFFSQKNSNYIRGDRLNESWKTIQRSINIEPTVFHGLRHTFCTLLARQNVPIKVAATLMGHTDLSTTSQIYTHIERDIKDAAIQKLSIYL